MHVKFKHKTLILYANVLWVPSSIDKISKSVPIFLIFTLYNCTFYNESLYSILDLLGHSFGWASEIAHSPLLQKRDPNLSLPARMNSVQCQGQPKRKYQSSLATAQSLGSAQPNIYNSILHSSFITALKLFIIWTTLEDSVSCLNEMASGWNLINRRGSVPTTSCKQRTSSRQHCNSSFSIQDDDAHATCVSEQSHPLQE